MANETIGDSRHQSSCSFIDKSDHFHNWAINVWKTVTPPLLTCEAVIAEACFLLSKTHGGEEAVMNLLENQVISIPFRLTHEVTAIKELMKRYQSVPMSLADACLVRMSELFPQSSVLTIDTDFFIYRQHRNQVISVIMPDRNT